MCCPAAAATCGGPSVGDGADRQPGAGAGQTAPSACMSLIAIDSGPNKGANTLLEFSGGPGQPSLAVGDHVRISRQVDPAGTTTYSFYDFERTWPLIALAAAFAVVVVAVARWRGLRAMIGIIVAFAVLVVFMLPALRDGAAAIPVALVASAMILYAVIYLAHGVSLRTSAALLGTLASLLLAAVLSWGAIELAHLTGLSEDQNNEVAAYLGHVSITGLLLAGFIVGSLGVLNDVTVTQASTVFELAELGGDSRRAIFRRRDARRPRPHREHCLHAGAGLRGQRVAAAVAVQCGQPIAGRCVDQRECGDRDRPLGGRWHRAGPVGAADDRDRRSAGRTARR